MNKIRISGVHYEQIKEHLYPGDNCEAVAIALCGRTIHNGNHVLTVQEVFLVPYDSCLERRTDFVHVVGRSHDDATRLIGGRIVFAR